MTIPYTNLLKYMETYKRVSRLCQQIS